MYDIGCIYCIYGRGQNPRDNRDSIDSKGKNASLYADNVRRVRDSIDLIRFFALFACLPREWLKGALFC